MKTMVLAVVLAALTITITGAASDNEPSYTWRIQLGANGTVFGDPVQYCVGKECYISVLSLSSTVPDGTVLNIHKIISSTGVAVWTTRLNFIIPAYSGWIDFEPPKPGSFYTAGKLFVGSTCGVEALDAASGELVWRWSDINGCYDGVPAHPSFAEPGVVIYTYENGVRSSVVTALNATTGKPLWRTNDIAYTLIWISRIHALAVYGAATALPHPYNQGNSTASTPPPQIKGVGVVARNILTGELVWEFGGDMPFSAPGLWDNPNLDVDSTGRYIYLYTKPNMTTRIVYCLNGSTGEPLWQLPNYGSLGPTDYDTYAFDNDFVRMITDESSNQTRFLLQRFSHQEGQPLWSTTFKNADQNSILLVGGSWAFSFGLSSAAIYGFSSLDGSPQWTLACSANPTTGVVSENNVMAFGTIDGYFNAVALR